jgi:hypothetical protein
MGVCWKQNVGRRLIGTLAWKNARRMHEGGGDLEPANQSCVRDVKMQSLQASAWILPFHSIKCLSPSTQGNRQKADPNAKVSAKVSM